MTVRQIEIIGLLINFKVRSSFRRSVIYRQRTIRKAGTPFGSAMFEANNIEETQPLPRTTRNQNDASITDMALLKRSAQLWEATIYKHHTPMECDPSNFASSVMRQ